MSYLLDSSALPAFYFVVSKSLSLRSAATGRLPHIDALIAATAALLDAVLVHRDPHFGQFQRICSNRKFSPINNRRHCQLFKAPARVRTACWLMVDRVRWVLAAQIVLQAATENTIRYEVSPH